MFKSLKRALGLLHRLGIVSAGTNTIYDVAHMLIAKKLGAAFVTADKRACRRAVKLGVPCYNYRTGEMLWPEEK